MARFSFCRTIKGRECLQSRERASFISHQSTRTQLHKSLRALGSFLSEETAGVEFSSQPSQVQTVCSSAHCSVGCGPELMRFAPELQRNNELFGLEVFVWDHQQHLSPFFVWFAAALIHSLCHSLAPV